MITLLVHILNEDPIVGEVDEMPSSETGNLILRNPRMRDGKPVSYIDREVTTVIWPMHRVNFIEVMPGEGEEEIISHVRE